MPKISKWWAQNDGDPTLIQKQKKTKLGCPPRSHVIGREVYTKVASMVEGMYMYKHLEIYEQRES